MCKHLLCVSGHLSTVMLADNFLKVIIEWSEDICLLHLTCVCDIGWTKNKICVSVEFVMLKLVGSGRWYFIIYYLQINVVFIPRDVYMCPFKYSLRWFTNCVSFFFLIPSHTTSNLEDWLFFIRFLYLKELFFLIKYFS